MRQLPEKVFMTLGKLISLDLSSNKLTSLPKFEKTWALKRLSIADNELKPGALRPLRPLSWLTDLNIDSNDLKNLPSDSLPNMPSVKTLSLRKCGIAKIHYFAFNGLNSVASLDLSSNEITVLTKTPFLKLLSLRFLRLDNNPIICTCSLWDFKAWVTKMKITVDPSASCWIGESTEIKFMKKKIDRETLCKTTAKKPTTRRATVKYTRATMKPTTRRPTVKRTRPTAKPTTRPTVKPTTRRPTVKRTKPTVKPTRATVKPTTNKDTIKPTTRRPTVKRTRPTVKPTTRRPTMKPSRRTTVKPTTKRATVKRTTKRATVKPTTGRPTVKPTRKPTVKRTTRRPTTRASTKFSNAKTTTIRHHKTHIKSTITKRFTRTSTVVQNSSTVFTTPRSSSTRKIYTTRTTSSVSKTRTKPTAIRSTLNLTTITRKIRKSPSPTDAEVTSIGPTGKKTKTSQTLTDFFTKKANKTPKYTKTNKPNIRTTIPVQTTTSSQQTTLFTSTVSPKTTALDKPKSRSSKEQIPRSTMPLTTRKTIPTKAFTTERKSSKENRDTDQTSTSLRSNTGKHFSKFTQIEIDTKLSTSLRTNDTSPPPDVHISPTVCDVTLPVVIAVAASVTMTSLFCLFCSACRRSRDLKHTRRERRREQRREKEREAKEHVHMYDKAFQTHFRLQYALPS